MTMYHLPEDAVGGAKSKGGMNAWALNRGKGYSAMLSAFTNKTKSHYRGSSKHYHYEGCGGYGENENICGYGPGNGGTSMPGGYKKHY